MRRSVGRLLTNPRTDLGTATERSPAHDVHNHPSGGPAPSPDDARLTIRLAQAADVLDIALLDRLIVGDAGRYFSFREAGTLTHQRAEKCRA